MRTLKLTQCVLKRRSLWVSASVFAIFAQVATIAVPMLWSGLYPRSRDPWTFVDRPPKFAVRQVSSLLMHRASARRVITISDQEFDADSSRGIAIFRPSRDSLTATSKLHPLIQSALSRYSNPSYGFIALDGMPDSLDFAEVALLGWPLRFTKIEWVYGDRTGGHPYHAITIPLPDALYSVTNPPWVDIQVPYRFEAVPLAINVIIFFGMTLSILIAIKILFCLQRIRCGRCWNCSYDISSCIGRCSECGSRLV